MVYCSLADASMLSIHTVIIEEEGKGIEKNRKNKISLILLRQNGGTHDNLFMVKIHGHLAIFPIK